MASILGPGDCQRQLPVSSNVANVSGMYGGTVITSNYYSSEPEPASHIEEQAETVKHPDVDIMMEDEVGFTGSHKPTFL